jgi:hypothetical protein
MTRRLFLPVLAMVAAVAMVALGSQVARADERDFTLVNNSSSTIVELYVGPSSSDDWGSDILGAQVLGPGQQVNIYFTRFNAGQCIYDLKVVLDDGSSASLYGVDLCNTTVISYP